MINEISHDQEQDFREEAQALREELEQLKANNQIVWELLIQIGNRLQRSSTSIKMAVSSLLEYDIFWDEKTRYEFLQDIDNSTDELAELIILATLAFRSQAKTLEIEAEPQTLQEILAALKNNVGKNFPGIELTVQYPPEGRPAMVDFQYFSLALGLLIEVVFSRNKGPTRIAMVARESDDYWQLQIDHLNPTFVAIIRHFCDRANDTVTITKQLLPEHALKLMTACRVLHLQKIRLAQEEVPEDSTAICLLIPMISVTS